MIENQFFIDHIIHVALEEDLGSGDLTTDAIMDAELKGNATLLARERLLLAGLAVFRRVFKILSPEIEFKYYFDDGQMVPSDKEICIISGSISSILKAERTALNFLQRMSGIATLVRSYVDKVGMQDVRLLDTRKTAPGLRLLDKYAVRVGGGFNHRFGLYDGILIKDNHIMVAGSITRAVVLAREKAPHTVKVEVEVEDLAGVEEAVQAGADAILLDNMSPEIIRQAIKLVDGRVTTEASGNITLDNIAEVARTGVDLISVGAFTHSVRGVDMSLDLI
ncbi:MAG: carboxylating nicotinate-nucleotide diphosphorylase [Thermodesulfobacteriota bacterium]|nr:carboxylating nicotinate-nucleotide diphosphorylase [Thermodesulfobacteriota bacterium]